MQHKNFLGVTCLWDVKPYSLDSCRKDGQRETNLFNILLAAGKKCPHKKMSFALEPNIEHVDGHYNGHI